MPQLGPQILVGSLRNENSHRHAVGHNLFTEHSELLSRLASHGLLKKITHFGVHEPTQFVKEHQKMLRLPSSRFQRARNTSSCRKQRLNQRIHSENQDGADRRKKQAHVAADEHELSFQNAKRIYRNKMRLS